VGHTLRRKSDSEATPPGSFQAEWVWKCRCVPHIKRNPEMGLESKGQNLVLASSERLKGSFPGDREHLPSGAHTYMSENACVSVWRCSVTEQFTARCPGVQTRGGDLLTTHVGVLCLDP
jgi:hypothetical protein